jgi:Tol biopolymer transport system component
MVATVSIHRLVFAPSWFLLGLASIVFLFGCGESGDETSADSTGTIVFTVNRSGFGEIWVMDSDGHNRIQLTEPSPPEVDASGSTSPAWSPDGRLIAYASSGEAVEEDQGDVEIYVMSADGGERRRLTDDEIHDATPTWSPDGQSIAFAHTPGLGTEDADGVIVVMNADGTGRVEITRHPENPAVIFDSHPAWSPDGSQIAFTRATFTSSIEPRVAIYTIDPTGTGERLLIEDAAEPAWSPDGSSIAFTSTRDRFGETCFHECGPSGEIYVVGADGTDPQRLTKSQAHDHSPSWAPDGQRIAFSSDRSKRDDHENEIYVMAVDGSGLQRLTTNDVWDLEPAWR